MLALVKTRSFSEGPFLPFVLFVLILGVAKINEIKYNLLIYFNMIRNYYC